MPLPMPRQPTGQTSSSPRVSFSSGSGDEISQLAGDRHPQVTLEGFNLNWPTPHATLRVNAMDRLTRLKRHDRMLCTIIILCILIFLGLILFYFLYNPEHLFYL